MDSAELLQQYLLRLAAFNGDFLERYEDFDPRTMVIGMTYGCIGLYKALEGPSKQRFIEGTQAAWDVIEAEEKRGH